MPATRKEEALWLLEKLAPDSAANNLSVVFQVAGRLRPPVLRESLIALLGRHDVLRTVYRPSERGLAKAVLPAEEVALDVVTADAAGGSLARRLPEFVRERFPLDGSLLLRAGVFAADDGDVCCLVVHHLVFDTLSGITLLEELAALYDAILAGRPPGTANLPAPSPQPVDGEPSRESSEFWRRHLDGFEPDGADLSCGRPAGEDPALAGDQITITLADRTRDVLRRLQRELGAPEATILLSSFYLLLDAHGAGRDLVVGTPVNARSPGAARAIGYHVNMLPLRMRIDPSMRVRDFVRSVRDVFFAALEHSGVPADTGRRGRSLGHVFNYVPDAVLPEFTIGGATARSLVVENGHSRFDLEFFVLSAPESLRLRAVYRTALFDRHDIERMLRRYEELLLALDAGADRAVGGLRIWSRRDRDTIEAANATDAPEPAPTIPQAFLSRAALAPEAIAVVDGDRACTYGQIRAAAVATCTLLRAHGVAAGDVVAIAARRGPELAGAVFGCWLAGAAYLPIDPEHPAGRVRYQLDDSGSAVVLTDSAPTMPTGTVQTVLPLVPVAGDTPSSVESPAADGDHAYLIYTSGSTGKPKGTLVTHGGLANVVRHFADELAFAPDQAILWLTTFAFDISALELYLPLANGGRVVVAADEARINGDVLLATLRRHRVDVVQATPTSWRLVLDQAADGLAGRRLLCGGEPAPLPLVNRLAAAGAALHHVYGPTETTIWSTSTIVSPEPDGPLSIGRPIRNTQIMVLDSDDRELPVGVRGELCIAGAGVAVGYHDRPELTGQRFGNHPEHGRFYRTGDVAHWNDDGTLTLFGRADRQVKLRGNRVELGEVEAVLAEHPRVRAAAVIVLDDDATLVAFVEAEESAELADELWRHCRAALPSAEVPQEFIAVDGFPANASAKTDYPALAEIARRRRAEVRGDPEAGSDVDDALVLSLISLWQRVLERSDVAADTNFFMHGGHSMLGALLVQQVEAITGVTVRLADLFADPTPRALAGRVRTARALPTAVGDD